MHEKDLVSIIVPVYNVSAYLNECIDSLIIQSYSNIEIILVDDGSTDGSGQICDQYSKLDDRIVVIHKKNGGLSDARNAGLNAMHGQYVAFVDSDDWIDEQMIQKFYSISQSTNADIVAGGYVAIYKNMHVQCSEKSGIYSMTEALKLLLYNKELHDHVCTKLFRASIWDEIRFPKNKVFEDIRTTYKTFLKSERIVVTDYNLYFYRQRGEGIARGTFNKSKLQNINAINELLRDRVINQNIEYISLLKKRLLRVKCYILRDMFLRTPDDILTDYQTIAEGLFRIVKKNRILILSDKDFEKSLKFMAFVSFAGFTVTRKVFSSSLLKKKYALKYQYYD